MLRKEIQWIILVNPIRRSQSWDCYVKDKRPIVQTLAVQDVKFNSENLGRRRTDTKWFRKCLDFFALDRYFHLFF